jgi:hypothetical protein
MNNFSKGSPQNNQPMNHFSHTIDYDRNDKNKIGYGIQNMKSDPYQNIDPYGAGTSNNGGDRSGRKIVQPPGKRF